MPGLMSLTRTVPASVPSLFDSPPNLVVKKSVPLKAGRSQPSQEWMNLADLLPGVGLHYNESVISRRADRAPAGGTRDTMSWVRGPVRSLLGGKDLTGRLCYEKRSSSLLEAWFHWMMVNASESNVPRL